jgi:hypothetical protein
MKKLFLLLAGAAAAFNASAQYNNSIMLTAPKGAKPMYREDYGTKGDNSRDILNARRAHGSLQKTTAVNQTWWSFEVANDDGSSLINKGFNTVYPDSNLLVTSGTPPFYWWCMGLGTSFDPESQYFSTLWANTSVTPPPALDTTTGYFIDSVLVVGFYNQIDATVTDTLYVDITETSDTNAWRLSYHNPTNTITWGITVAPDTTYRFGDAKYDAASNGFAIASIPNSQRLTKILNTAAANDTAANGLNVWALPLTTPMWVPKHKKVVALTHFATAVAHPLGTDINTSNRWIQFTWDFNTPLQRQGDYNTGLLISNEERYNTASAYKYMTNTIAVPTYFYTAPVVIHNPYYEFYLRQTTSGVGVASVDNKINAINAFPNPANSQLTVTFDVAGANNATVTLVNVIGQEVATKSVNQSKGNVVFNTAALPAGVYFYTVEANGQRSTGRVSIAH